MQNQEHETLQKMIADAQNRSNLNTQIIIYHGSTEVITKPYFKGGKPYNDYGHGFYCSDEIEIAKEWAGQPDDTIGYCNRYKLNLKDLKILDLNQSPYHTLNWLALLLQNRIHNDIKNPNSKKYKNRQYIIDEFTPDTNNYDIIIGYRADDSYFKWAKDFVADEISLSTLERSMKLGELGQQIVIVSEKAYCNLEFLDYIEVSPSYFEKRMLKRNNATEIYMELRDNDEISSTDITASRLRKEELKNEYFCISRDISR